jgi:hypothetical protein
MTWWNVIDPMASGQTSDLGCHKHQHISRFLSVHKLSSGWLCRWTCCWQISLFKDITSLLWMELSLDLLTQTCNHSSVSFYLVHNVFIPQE